MNKIVLVLFFILFQPLNLFGHEKSDLHQLCLEARDYLNNLITNATTIEFKTDYTKDYFGRILSFLILDDEDVSSKIVSQNLGVVYDKNNKKDWCS